MLNQEKGGVAWGEVALGVTIGCLSPGRSDRAQVSILCQRTHLGPWGDRATKGALGAAPTAVSPADPAPARVPASTHAAGTGGAEPGDLCEGQAQTAKAGCFRNPEIDESRPVTSQPLWSLLCTEGVCVGC